jgi:hypothetical protein
MKIETKIQDYYSLHKIKELSNLEFFIKIMMILQKFYGKKIYSQKIIS